MTLATERNYKNWQARLQKGSWYKYWWQFWSNYSWLTIVPIFAYIYFYFADENFVIEIIIAFFLSRIILVPIISKLYPSARPYQQYKFEPIASVFLSRRTDSLNSFPSSHVISIMATSGVMMLTHPLLGSLLFGIGLMTGLGRIVLSFHYPRDVFFSTISGLIIGIIVSVVV
ncbi:phosphatase PAP2 family protein [bacterium]|nr:MAG: phosphatase PAP2 family protein [bacterium]